MGAEIIKVEMAPNGDHARAFDYIRDKRSASSFNKIAARKASASISASPGGIALIKTARSQNRRSRREFCPRRDRPDGPR